MTARSRRPLACSLAMVAVAFAAVLGLVPGSQALGEGGPGAIGGTVRDRASGAPVAGACVSAAQTQGPVVLTTNSAEDGSYLIEDLAPGTYRVRFRGCRDGVSGVEFYSGKPENVAADLVTVVSGQTTSGVDGALDVTQAPPATEPTPSSTIAPAPAPAAATTAEPSGPPGAISGTVTDQSSGAPLGAVCVQASQAQGSGLGTTDTAADGTYTVSDLAPGQYRVRFRGCTPDVTGEQYFNVKPDRATADMVTVNPGATTPGIDGTLVSSVTPEAAASAAARTTTTTFPSGPPGSISGAVTDEGTGVPLEGACVSAAQTQGSGFATANTTADGTYVLGDLAPGNYRVRFRGCTKAVAGEQYFDGSADSTGASLVTVMPGEAVAGIDGRLMSTGVAAAQGSAATTVVPGTPFTGYPPGMPVPVPVVDPTSAGAISGTVTAQDSGGSLESVCVSAHRTQTADTSTTLTTGDGSYVLAGLAPGDYEVRFRDCGRNAFAAQAFQAGAPGDPYTLVTVDPGTTTQNVDAVLQPVVAQGLLQSLTASSRPGSTRWPIASAAGLALLLVAFGSGALAATRFQQWRREP